MADYHFGAARHTINGVAYDVPKKREFAASLAENSSQSVWLILPAEEVARGVADYRALVRGYHGLVAAELVVAVEGGNAAQAFASNRRMDIERVAADIANGSLVEPDPASGFSRIYWPAGERGAAGQRTPLFNLKPIEGLDALPQDWRVPHCFVSNDVNGMQNFKCRLSIKRQGISFSFYISPENLGVADQIPDYVIQRLEQWRT